MATEDAVVTPTKETTSGPGLQDAEKRKRDEDIANKSPIQAVIYLLFTM
jgi:hypothetical protein